MTTLENIAKEINDSWIDKYKSEIEFGILAVLFRPYGEDKDESYEPIAFVNEKFKIISNDNDVVEQLESYINR